MDRHTSQGIYSVFSIVMAESGDQLVSFFVYSLFVYPVTNYIVSPQRKYPRWKAALYAVVFLLAVSTLHMVYDNSEAGPNHYRLLGVTRDSPLNAIKKSYRGLSLELHPDKNKDPLAADQFLKVKNAFDVLSDKDKKREYNRLGDHGVKVLAQSVVDHKYIIIQMIVYYTSTLIFAFLMTFSEPTGDAFSICLFGMSVMLLIEMLLVLQEASLPGWFLPDTTPNDIVSVLHRLYPAFMNGGRCISGAFYVDRKAVRVVALEAVSNSSKEITLRACNVARVVLAQKLDCADQEEDLLVEAQAADSDVEDVEVEEVEKTEEERGGDEGEGSESDGDVKFQAFQLPKIRPNKIGVMEKQMSEVRRRVAASREGRSGALAQLVANKVKFINDPANLRKASSAGWNSMGWLLLRDVSIYLVARYSQLFLIVAVIMNLEAIQKAMEELRMAKEEIAKLQKSRVDAENNVKAALSLVDSVKDKSEGNSNYSDEAYWEDRYKRSTEPKKDVYEWYVSFSDIEGVFQEDVYKLPAKGKSLILVSGCGNSTLCEDISNKGFQNVHGMDYSPSVIKNMQERSKDLKLSHIRYFQADARYMPAVATGTYDMLFDKGTLDAVASAGASDTASASALKEVESIDALNYMIEMWRILKIGGVFVLISTMPPEIIEPLALTPLLASVPGVRGGASDWKQGCRVLPLTTQEGGQVYYYAIRKRAEITRLTSFRPGSSTSTSTSKAASAKSSAKVGAAADSSGIMAGIAALLEEAKKAKESMEAAADKQRQAAAEVREAESKRTALEGTLQSGLRDMRTGDREGGGEDDELGTGAGAVAGRDDEEEESTANRKNDELIQHAIEAAVRKVAPKVQLFPDLQGAAPTAEDSLTVYFLLLSTSEEEVAKVWSEDDTVSLVCSAATNQGAEDDRALYKAEEQPYEAFEYTDPPRALPSVSNLAPADRDLLERIGALDYLLKTCKLFSKAKTGRFFIGQVTLKLPSFGGCFHVSYVRTLTLPATAVTITDEGSDSKGKVVQRRVRLARSEPLLPRVAVHGARPDARNGAVRVLFAEGAASNANTSTTIRRRGAGAITNAAQTVVVGFAPALSMWVEDLSHIKTLNVITALNVTGSMSTHSTIGRTMAWAQPSATAPHTLELVVEVDILTSSAHGPSAGGEVRTVYGVLVLSDTLFERCSIDLSTAYGHVDAEGRFVCRLPYTPHPVKSNARKTPGASSEAAQTTALFDFVRLSTALQNTSTTQQEPSSVSVQCAFCKAEVVTEQAVNGLRPLPTGLLDNMMHDFICCEELPSSGLTSSDMETLQHTLLYGPLYASVHPAHLASSAVQLLCKTHSTSLDVFTGCGGALATAPIPLGGRVAASGSVVGGAVFTQEQRRQKVLQAFKTVINIDTCLIRCERCASYLGDAHLQGENCDPSCEGVHAPSSSSAIGAAPAPVGHVGQQNFTIADLRDVRFALQTVRISATQTRSVGVSVSAEQFVARSILHINTTYNLSTFCLFASDADFENQKLSSSETTGIIIKLVSPDYRTSLPITSSTAVESAALSLCLVDCVKVSFSVGTVVDAIAGNEARLPLQFHELQQVIAALQERSARMGPSPFKGQTLSYLRK